MTCIVDNDVVLAQTLEGPLSAQIERFARWAREEGYAFPTRRRKVMLAACFSRWLGQQAVNIRSVASAHAARYLRSRAHHVKIQSEDAGTLRQFLDFLRRQAVVPAKQIPPPQLASVEQALHAFERYLREERMLAEVTIIYYVSFVRGFLAHRFGDGPVRLSRLCAGDVVRFVQRQAPRLHLKRAKLLTTALRSFLHYARDRGEVTCDLAAAVPTVANWSMPSIPRAILARMVPVDSFVCGLVRRLQFFRSLDPLPADRRLLARPRSKEVLVRQLRDYLHQVCHALGLSTRIVPHQCRHTYATEMLRAGMGFPAVMKLLGHTSPEMTMRYLDVALHDLQRELELARSKPRHLVPQPKTPFAPRAGLDGLIDSLLAAQHVLEMFRRTLPNGTSRRRRDRLSNRLTKIVTEVRKLATP